MNRYKQYAGSSKASASTVCQKCLKKGHYSYECTASSKDRPYIARPSRTQQLMNPKLMPKLSVDQPPQLEPKKGLADAILAKAAEERGRKRQRTDTESERSDSASSVSTVSTTLSKSPPARQSRRSPSTNVDSIEAPRQLTAGKKSQRRQVESSPRRQESRNGDAKRRRRRSVSSVSSRGRSISKSSASSKELRRRHRRDSHSNGTHRVNRDLRSPSVEVPQVSNNKETTRSGDQGARQEAHRRGPRSPSPFSKRLALTQAMNTR